MAFNIESFKKNFKDVTDKTVKKTGELTTIAKLNMSIKAEEAKLSDCYKAIGRLFYTAERDNLDNTEEIATYIMQADKIKAVIADCQKELALLRNVVICEGCNNEISGDCIFCPICGLKVTKPVAEPAEEVCEYVEYLARYPSLGHYDARKHEHRHGQKREAVESSEHCPYEVFCSDCERRIKHAR